MFIAPTTLTTSEFRDVARVSPCEQFSRDTGDSNQLSTRELDRRCHNPHMTFLNGQQSIHGLDERGSAISVYGICSYRAYYQLANANADRFGCNQRC